MKKAIKKINKSKTPIADAFAKWEKNATPEELQAFCDSSNVFAESLGIGYTEEQKAWSTVLKYKTQVLDQKIVVPNIDEDCVLVVKVGNEERPASEEHIKQVTESIKTIEKTKGMPRIMVAHHAIEFLVVPQKLLKDVIVIGGLDSLMANIRKL
jgi:hypothetical protein